MPRIIELEQYENNIYFKILNVIEYLHGTVKKIWFKLKKLEIHFSDECLLLNLLTNFLTWIIDNSFCLKKHIRNKFDKNHLLFKILYTCSYHLKYMNFM